MPSVSVVMSALNAQATIGLALRSIERQTFRDWELIVVDDGSTDRTRAVIAGHADPRIRLLAHDQRRGLAARLNEAIAAARGDFIARMDADDIAYPKRLERQVGYLAARPKVDLVGSNLMAFGRSGEPIGVMRLASQHHEIRRHPERGFDLPHPTWLGRTRFFQRFPYNEAALRAQDQELLLRAHHDAVFANLDEVLLGYRQERILPRHVLHGRMTYGRALWRYAQENRAWRLAHKGLVTQVWRTAAVLPILYARRQDIVLARRYASPTPQEMTEWRAVYDALQAENHQGL